MGLVAEETVEVLVPSSLVAYFNYLYEKVRTVGTAFSPQWVYETFFKEGAYIGPPVWPCAMILNTYGIESLDGLQEVRGSLTLLGVPNLVSAKDLSCVGGPLIIHGATSLRSLPSLNKAEEALLGDSVWDFSEFKGEHPRFASAIVEDVKGENAIRWGVKLFVDLGDLIHKAYEDNIALRLHELNHDTLTVRRILTGRLEGRL
jgi:hypothetical protein